MNFVGFGFGPIQSGLFLLEAFRSGNFRRYTVAEIDAQLVRAIRDAGGSYSINIAHHDRIEVITVRGVAALDPHDPGDRQRLVQAVVQADEVATALPSVEFFDRGGPASAAAILGQGLRRRPPASAAVVYTAENHNHAAEILSAAILRHAPDALRSVQILNTVIGKMSGVICDAQEIQRLRLTPLTPGAGKAILVEAFNRIFIAKITLRNFKRGITVFEEKPDLLPFEEAKLYGHNAVHALIGYFAHQRGLATMDQVAGHADLLALARSAFVEESGAALIRKYAALHEELFTPEGYCAYADDLLQRMLNPNLNDRVQRVIRDPQRKLGWADRFFGAMRLALEQGIVPRNLARGGAAAVAFLLGAPPRDRQLLATTLRGLWGKSADSRADELIDLVWQASPTPHTEPGVAETEI